MSRAASTRPDHVPPPACARSRFQPVRAAVLVVRSAAGSRPLDEVQLDLDAHGARSLACVLVRIWQRLRALAAVIWHNDTINASIKRSLTAYDH